MIYLFISIIALIVIGFCYFLTRYFFLQVVMRKTYAHKDLYEAQLKHKLFRKEFYENLNKEEVSVVSHDGLILKGLYIEGQSHLNKTIIIVHGITVSYTCSIKYIEMFSREGWNILIYDHRRHGYSEGKYSTYGYYEKMDLDKWVNWVVDRNGKDAIIGLHGESMGAATVLQYAKINKYVKFIIADCTYSNLNELLSYHLKEDFHIPTFPILQLTNLRAKRLAKFDFNDISPIDDIKSCELPIMFIHGKDDTFVPWKMSQDMYDAKEKGIKKLYFAEKAEHACSIEVHRENYEKEVMEFVNSVV